MTLIAKLIVLRFLLDEIPTNVFSFCQGGVLQPNLRKSQNNNVCVAYKKAISTTPSGKNA